MRKNLVEALVLSKLDYGDTLCYNIPKYLQKQKQRVQNATATFAQHKYSKETDVSPLNWLPIRERIEFSRAKLAFKAFHFLLLLLLLLLLLSLLLLLLLFLLLLLSSTFKVGLQVN